MGRLSRIPHLERAVGESGDRPPTVRTHGHASARRRVAGERAQLAAGLQIPYFERPVPGSRDRLLPVWTQRHVIDRVRVADESAQLASSRQKGW